MNQSRSLSKLAGVVPLLMSAALAGCAGEAGDDGASNDTVASENTEVSQQALGAPHWSSACFKRPQSAPITNLSVDVGGETRTATVHIPANRRGPILNFLNPRPVVLSFHAAGFTSETSAYDGMDAAAEEHDFIVVRPQASGPPFYSFWGLNLLTFQPIDEAAFIRALLDKLGAETCIDESRVVANGLSNGAWMSEYIACNAPDRIAAIGTAGSSGFICDHAVNVPRIGYHGADDLVTIWQGVPGFVVPVEDDWNTAAVNNGCQLPAKKEIVKKTDGTVEKWSYKGCKAETVFYKLQGQGHNWPGRPLTGVPLDWFNTLLAIWPQVAWPFPWVTPAQASENIQLTNMKVDATTGFLKFFAHEVGGPWQ